MSEHLFKNLFLIRNTVVSSCLQHLHQLFLAILGEALPGKIIGKSLICKEFRLKNTGLHGEDDVAERLAQELSEDFWPFAQKPRTKSLPLECGKNIKFPNLQEVRPGDQMADGCLIHFEIAIVSALREILCADTKTAKRRSIHRVCDESGNDTLFLVLDQLDHVPLQDGIPARLPEIARDRNGNFPLIDTLDNSNDV